MTTLHRSQVAHFQIVWMLAVVGVLTLFDALSVPLFFSAALFGLLVLVEMGTPRYVQLPWTRRLRQFLAVCLLVFGLYVGVQLAAMVPPGAF